MEVIANAHNTRKSPNFIKHISLKNIYTLDPNKLQSIVVI